MQYLCFLLFLFSWSKKRIKILELQNALGWKGPSVCHFQIMKCCIRSPWTLLFKSNDTLLVAQLTLLFWYSKSTLLLLWSYRNLAVILVLSAPSIYVQLCLLCQTESRLSFRSKYCDHCYLICFGLQFGMVSQSTKEMNPANIAWEQT